MFTTIQLNKLVSYLNLCDFSQAYIYTFLTYTRINLFNEISADL